MAWRPRYTEQQVRDAVASARSLAEALRTLGLRAAGGNHRTLHKLIAHYGISIEHLDPRWAQRRAPRRSRTPLTEILVEGSTYSRGHLKDRLFDEGVKRRQCERCGLGDVWRGQPMSLILDHINGVPTDNRIENLRIVCPNCAATLETHCGRKNRLEREPRACLYCATEFIPKYPTHRYCTQRCGSHSSGTPGPRPELRKVTRPSYGQLRSELEATSFVAVGRKYGVSDNAVRKWLRCYKAEAAEAQATAVGSGLAAQPRLGLAGSETRDLDARHATAANDEVVVLRNPVRLDDLDRELRVDGKPVGAEGGGEIEASLLARASDRAALGERTSSL